MGGAIFLWRELREGKEMGISTPGRQGRARGLSRADQTFVVTDCGCVGDCRCGVFEYQLYLREILFLLPDEK